MIGTDSTQVPSVIIRSSISGVVSAQLDANQPFLTQNDNATIKKYVYDVSISPQEKSFEVVALLAENNNINTVGQTIDVTTCKANITFEPSGTTIEQQPIDLTAPRIFDVRFQIANGTTVLSSNTTNQYVDNQPLTVYSIINSPTPITKAELRYVPIGQDFTKYSVIEMSVVPLQISNTTYAISGTIPSEMMQGPAINYWVDVQNEAGKISDSDTYAIGVKPDYPIGGKLELDVVQYGAAGSAENPTAYFTNNGSSVYGTISLLVDGDKVYTSQPQLFNGTTQTSVSLQWQTLSDNQVANHLLQAKADFYGQNFTANASMTTFSAVKTIPITEFTDIKSITDNNNHTIANPRILYSSYHNDGTTRYKVTAPDGTCVIGGSDGCLVKDSTFGERGQLKSITIENQIYRVRYSGPDDPLERFSITSVDPIVGQWKVEIDSSQGFIPQADAMNDVSMKVTYRPVETPFLTLQ